jgi:hypothetical protein
LLDHITNSPTTQELSVLFLEGRTLDGLEQFLRTHANVAVCHLVYPANDTLFVGEYGGRKSYVSTSVGPDMANIETVQQLSLCIGDEFEAGAEASSKRLRHGRRVDADGYDLHIVCRDASIELPELPELRGTKRSPISSIEQIEYRFLADHSAGREAVAEGVGERKVGKSFAYIEVDITPLERRKIMDVPKQQDKG